jgi:hypothetical protein
MIISLGAFKSLIIIAIASSALLMIYVFGQFIYELKQNELW